jgi:hypothetical protein
MLVSLLKKTIATPRNDNMLHFSQHLQHDRHAALYYAHGYPSVPDPSWQSIFPLLQGTAIHETIHEILQKNLEKYKAEHPIIAKDPDLTLEWTGTADAYAMLDGEFWLLDYKTISGVGMSFLDNQPKPEHVMQVSAYYHFGPSQKCKTGIVYFPTTPDYKKRWEEPRLIEFDPLPKRDIIARMRQVEEAIHDYEEDDTLPDYPAGEYTWKKTNKVYKLWYRPHYSSLFCPWAAFHDDPCGCSQQKPKFIAEYKNGELIADENGWEIAEEVGLPYETQDDV